MTFNELVKSGAIPIGTELVWKRKVLGETHTATVAHVAIRTADGKLHKSPSGAARHLNNGKPVDGWLAWKLKSTGDSLASLRSKSV
jgi:hypothetical protein